MRAAQILGVEKQTPIMGGPTSSHCKGHGFRERWRIGALFTISLLESEWNVKIRIDCLPLSVSLLVVNKEVDGSPQSCLKPSCCQERSQPEDKDRTTRVAEGKCHSPHDGVDIWIKPTLPLDFTDTYASKFWYHSSLCDWSFLFETKRHLSDTATQPNNSFSLKISLLPRNSTAGACMEMKRMQRKICGRLFLVGKSKSPINQRVKYLTRQKFTSVTWILYLWNIQESARVT